ncbi:MAG: NAD(P)/FAD-dependent oxidoreductase, partial [Clostridiales bacterium]|nr:NAD(P)/FAD-dependent oxidoreductase [Clostridiales bacterium]
MKYTKTMSEGRLAGSVAKNRIVMSPMGENMANADGSVSDQMIAYYARRAQGGTGIIMPGVVCVEYPRGKTESCQSRLDEKKYIKDFARMAREVHRYGALLIPQLHHSGASTNRTTTDGVQPISITANDQINMVLSGLGAHVEGDAEYLSADGMDAARADVHVATVDDIKYLEKKYIEAAVNAKAAGCDGVELHGAHSYLICQFLTPFINDRTDEYGGNAENRARFAVNIIKGIRKACGPDFIIGIRMPVHRWLADSLTDEDSIAYAKAFDEAGADFLDVSGGIPERPTNLIESEEYPEGWRVDLSEKIRPYVKCAVFALGGIRHPQKVEEILESGAADYVVMGRQLICDPDWCRKVEEGREDEIRYCISCSKGCYGELSNDRFISCALNPETGHEYMIHYGEENHEPRNVVVVGGGIAGMQAAITSAKQGYHVTLFEASDKLGGQIELASKGPNKSRIQWVYDYFAGETYRQGVKVILNTKADLEAIKAYRPDHVFVAAGSLPFNPPVEGVEKAALAWDVLKGEVTVPENSTAIVLGGGTVGCEIAEILRNAGNETYLLEMTGVVAGALEPFHQVDVLTRMNMDEHMHVLTNSKVTAVTDTGVKYVNGGEEKMVEGAFIVSAFGQRPQGKDLLTQLKNEGIPCDVVGDANKVGNFLS